MWILGLKGLRQSPYCNICSFAVDSKKNVHSMLKMLWSVEVPLKCRQKAKPEGEKSHVPGRIKRCN